MVDVRYIFQVELNKNRPKGTWLDADRYSEKLRETHQFLWSKALPNGKIFTLEKVASNRLRHKSELGEFILSSDRAVPTFFKRVSWLKRYPYLAEIPADKTLSFWNLSETIGGMTIWPAVKNGGNTINQNKCFGRNRTIIADRLDLTLECVRRYYAEIDSPLASTFERYNNFFRLFETFENYINFFIFQDWVCKDYKTVLIAPPFDNFNSTAVPSSTDEYLSHRIHIMNLLKKEIGELSKCIMASFNWGIIPALFCSTAKPKGK